LTKVPTKVIAITSLPAVGNAGIKNILSVLGADVLPVPTLFLSGLGNLLGHRRFLVPFAEMLPATFHMAEQESYSLIVYTGYLSDADQISIIRKSIHRYRSIIQAIVVDPVCGDQGQPYVDQPIIDRLPELLDLADWALPNITELQLLLNLPTAALATSELLFRQRFPHLNYVITGLIADQHISNRIYTPTQSITITHPYTGQPHPGAGDLFAALFIYYHFLRLFTALESVDRAGTALATRLKTEVEPDHFPTYTNIIL